MPMAIGRPNTELVLSVEEARAVVRAGRLERAAARAGGARAKLVLGAAQGESNIAIAERMGWSLPTVGKWRARLLVGG
jgi:hypothetical protein